VFEPVITEIIMLHSFHYPSQTI